MPLAIPRIVILTRFWVRISVVDSIWRMLWAYSEIPEDIVPVNFRTALQ
jgi:hypothetical protein